MVETIALYTLRSKVRVRMKLTEMIFKLESGIYNVNPDKTEVDILLICSVEQALHLYSNA